VMHHDPRFFSEPERFDPLRWTPEEKASRPKFSYFPFGGGPRLCIGEPFAWMEGTLLLASIASQWQMRLPTKQVAKVEFQPLITLRPRHGMPLVLERRRDLNRQLTPTDGPTGTTFGPSQMPFSE